MLSWYSVLCLSYGTISNQTARLLLGTVQHAPDDAGEGRANAQLIAFRADVLEVDPAQIEIVAGEDKPNKIVSVETVTTAWIEERLGQGH